MAIKPPPLDTRSYDDLVSQIELGAQLNAPPWAPAPPGAPLDPGSVLARLCARMASQAIDRLNQVPEKNYLAFLDLLGAQLDPPLAARAPLTFHPVDGSDEEPVVPAGTLVSAPAAPPLAEAVFATESDLTLTRAQLSVVFVRDANGTVDLVEDVTAVATGAAPGEFDPWNPTAPNEHSLYFRCEAILSLAHAANLSVSVSYDGPGQSFNWFYFGPNGWTQAAAPTLTQTIAITPPGGGPVTTSSTWTFTPPPPLVPTTVNGVLGRWMRISPQTVGQTVKVDGLGCGVSLSSHTAALDSLSTNGAALDGTKDFFPFGAQPQVSTAFYIQSTDAFSSPGASITITTAPSDFFVGLSSGFVLKSKLAWDVSTTAGWTQLAVTDTTSSLTVAGTLTFTLPQTVAPTTVKTRTGYFVRARMLDNPWSSVTFNGVNSFLAYSAVSLKSMVVTVSASPGAPADTLVMVNDGATATVSTPVSPFVPTTQAQALYLGFDRPFANRAETLFVQVAPPSTSDVQVNEPTGTTLSPPSPPRAIWEYRRSDGSWVDLGADDETAAFSRSGLVRFLGPVDAAPSAERGQQLYWLRVRSSGTFSFPPALRTIATNTTWAVNAATNTDELLGTSDGTAGQTFTTAQSPVLAGARLEVDEPQVPRADELQVLVDLDGPDPVTVVPAAPGQPARNWVRWHQVTDFYASGPGDRHYVLDAATGRVTFGDGANGLVPPAGRDLRAASYQSGGGEAGNRDANTITQFKAAVALVDKVTNPDPASGGSDGETLDELKDRAGTTVRHGGRAVTAQDYVDLAMAVSPDVARAQAVPPTFSPLDATEPVIGAGRVVVVIVPRSTDAQPVPSPELLDEVESYLQARCAPAVALLVAGPRWAQVTVTASIVPTSIAAESTARASVLSAIATFLHPLTGGRDGTGWAFGRVPRPSDFFALLAGLDGVDHVVSLTVSVGAPLDVAVPDPRVAATCLIYSGNHQITVLPAEET